VVKDSDKSIFDYWTNNQFYMSYNNEFNTSDYLSNKYEEVKQIIDFFNDGSYDRVGDYQDISLKDYLTKNGINEGVYHIANALFGTEAGTDMNTVSIGGFSKVCKDWLSGDDNYLINNGTHYDIIKEYFKNEISLIKYNTQITAIDFSINIVCLIDSFNNQYTADFCICTVPITQLKKLNFTPALPINLQTSLYKISMDSCAKIILKFKEKFWNDDLSLAVIKGYINVYWPTGQGKQSEDNVLTGMVGGEACRLLQEIYEKNKDEFINLVLSDIEEFMKVDNLKENLVDYFWFNWQKVEFIEGGYTYPFVGEKTERELFRNAVLGNKLYFAGEAFGINGAIATLHGAFESGENAAKLLLSNLNN
jgi:predicted NAD/FAD-dependent oxidoreductase